MGFCDNQLFIFDLDGTIVDSKQLMTEALRKCFKLIGIENPPYDHFFSLMGKSLNDIFKDINLPTELVGIYQDYCSSHKERINIFPGMHQIIGKLHALNKRLAILTGKDRVRTIEILRMHGLMQFFELVVASDDITYSKPHPEGVEKILHTLNMDKSLTILIGDGLFDIQCAKNAGIDSAFVCWGTGKKNVIEVLSPEFTFYNISELIQIIDRGDD